MSDWQAVPFPEIAPAPQVIHEELTEFVNLSQEERDLRARLRQIEERKQYLEPRLLDGMIAGHIQNARINGLTVYVSSQVWANARDGDYPRACAALTEVGLGELVQPRFSTQTVSSLIREWRERGDEIDPILADALTISEKFSLRTRKA